MAYFYISGTTTSSTPKLKAFQWNDLTNEFEEKCSKDMAAEISQSLYHKYSMVNTGTDGIIFNAYGAAMNVYKCVETTGWAFTENAVTVDNAAGALTGDLEDTTTTTSDPLAMTLIQPREAPDNYVAGTPPPIYGLHKTGYILKFTWGSNKLTMTAPSIVVPIDHGITVSPEHLDVGRKYLTLMAPTQCASAEDVSIITNASAWFYNLVAGTWSCRDLTWIKADMDQISTKTYTTADWQHVIPPPWP